MLEDVLYEILPVVGFATILSAVNIKFSSNKLNKNNNNNIQVFVLAVLWKAKRNPRIFMFFAVSGEHFENLLRTICPKKSKCAFFIELSFRNVISLIRKSETRDRTTCSTAKMWTIPRK